MLKFHERDKASREQKLQVMHFFGTGTLPKNSSFSATLFLYPPASYRPKGPMCVLEKYLVPVSAPPDLQAFASACTWATSLCLESSDSWQTIRMKLRFVTTLMSDVRCCPFTMFHNFHFFPLYPPTSSSCAPTYRVVGRCCRPWRCWCSYGYC